MPSAKQQRPAELAGIARFAANNRRDTWHSSTVGINLQAQLRRSVRLPGSHAHFHHQRTQAEPDRPADAVELLAADKRLESAVGPMRTFTTELTPRPAAGASGSFDVACGADGSRTLRESEAFEPAFVPLAITTEPPQITDTSPVLEPVATTSAIVTLEIGSDLVVRVPGDVPVERAAASVRAMRGAA
jgi:hypothetical protein